MAIVKQKEKKTPKPTYQYNFRADENLHNRIDVVFNQLSKVQERLKKAELIRDAIERGLTEIEQQLKEATK